MTTQVTVTTAIALTDVQRKALRSGLEKKFGTIEMQEVISTQIIGGLKITAGSSLYDDTIAAKLQSLRQK